jgi:hypothetical protein
MRRNTLLVTSINTVIVMGLSTLVVTAPSGFLCCLYGMLLASIPFFLVTIMAVSNHIHSCLFEKTINTHALVGVGILTFGAILDGNVGYNITPSWVFPHFVLVGSSMTLPFVFGRYALRRWDTFSLWV